MRILGLGGTLYDFAACLVEDGEVRVAIQQERLTKRPHSCDGSSLTEAYKRGSFDAYCKQLSDEAQNPDIAYCLDGEPVNSLDFVTLAGTRRDTLWRLGEFPLRWHARRIRSCDKHRAFAANAFFTSPFERAAVLVVDASGAIEPDGFDSCSLFAGAGTQLRQLDAVKSPYLPLERARVSIAQTGHISSLSVFAADCAVACGLDILQIDELFRLSFGGTDRYVNEFDEWMTLDSAGSISIDVDYVTFLNERIDKSAFLDEDELLQDRRDIALACRILVTRGAIHLARWAMERTGMSNLCLSGPVVSHPTIQQAIRENVELHDIYCPFDASEAGAAIGSALDAYYRMNSRDRHSSDDKRDHHAAYLGHEYSGIDVHKALRCRGSQLMYSRVPDVESAAAELIASGKTIGWFEGRSEFGSSEVGNRAVLSDPRCSANPEPSSSSTLVIAKENVCDYFSCNSVVPSTTVSPIRKGTATPICPTNADGTATLRAISSESNQPLYWLLRAFERTADVPALLHSRMTHEGVTAETPADACEVLLSGKIDALVANDYVVHRRRGH